MSKYCDADHSPRSIRKRKIWDSDSEPVTPEIKELPDENSDLPAEADSVALHLSAEEEQKLDSKIGNVLADEKDVVDQNAPGEEETTVRKLANFGWSVCHFHHLPTWLQDNDYLIYGHRPPLPSFRACLKSIFRIHTETVNIWTHLVGCIVFIGIALYFLLCQSIEIKPEEKLVFGAFFAGAIICLGCSFSCHTFNCHSQFIGKLVAKLDYCGIALLIMGSFVPWLYYGFYCHFLPKVVYLGMVCSLGIASITVGFLDKFSEPSWRTFRACVFITFGLSAVFPAVHYVSVEGWYNILSQKPLAWLILMGLLYIAGAVMYALRVPERWFPGKYDIWFHSHQIFHVCVLAAAYVHYHNISEMAMHRVTIGQCENLESAVY